MALGVLWPIYGAMRRWALVSRALHPAYLGTLCENRPQEQGERLQTRYHLPSTRRSYSHIGKCSWCRRESTCSRLYLARKNSTESSSESQMA